MFNLLVTADGTAWETDQLMQMAADRFKEYSGDEAKAISLADPESLGRLEKVHALLMYESGVSGPNPDVVRLGRLQEIRVAGYQIVFRFEEEGRLTRSLIQEFASRLLMGAWESTRTHWAIKDGGIPSELLNKAAKTVKYEIVLSFAGENRAYVEQVAAYLRAHEVKFFYDRYEEATLWGKDLAEHLDTVYRSARFCVIFVSKHYADKLWPNHERKAALARAVQEREEYILPVRFDSTELPGIRPTLGYLDLSHKTAEEVGALILKKLGRS